LVSRGILVLIGCVVGGSGCATQRSFVPSLEEVPREGLRLRVPIRFGVLDARTEKVESDRVVASIRNGLEKVYGPALEWRPFFEATPHGGVTARIRLLACEAKFGSRLVVTSAVERMTATAATAAVSPWGNVVAAAKSEQSIFTASFSGEGWWVGTSWMELEIEDKRFSGSLRMVVPIVAEHRESNVMGYSSADRASRRAWGMAGQGLIRTLDALVTAVRELETSVMEDQPTGR
jgi:hypothetical protein